MSNYPYLWLSKMVWTTVVSLWPVTAGLLLAVAVAAVVAREQLLGSPARTWLRFVMPFAVPPLILLWGSVMRHADPRSAAPLWPGHILIGLLLASAFLFATVVWRSPGVRWFAGSIVLLALWPTFLAAFVSAMSISNQWL